MNRLKSQILNTKCELTEKIFLFSLGLSVLLLYFKLFQSLNYSVLNISYFLTISLIFSCLIYLAYVDIKKMEVHNAISMALLLFLSLINIFLFFSKSELQFSSSWIYVAYDNLLGALILGSLSQLIVLISKEKALGQGDVRMLLITGLLIGKNNLIVWGYLTVFSALAYGLTIAIKKKKFKNVKIPLLPFIVFSILITLLLA